MKIRSFANRILATVLSLALLLSTVIVGTVVFSQGTDAWDGKAADRFANGTGTAVDPYEITTPAELLLAATSTGLNASGGQNYYVLANNIHINDVTSSDWASESPISWPIVDLNTASADTAFKGNFNGDGHIVYGLYAEETYTAPEGATPDRSKATGLFPTVGAGAVIKNVGIDQAHLSLTNNHQTAAMAFVGQVGLIGYAYNGSSAAISIDRCFIGEKVTMKAVFAGLVGDAKAATSASIVMTNCYAIPQSVSTFNDDEIYIYNNRFMIAAGRDNSAAYKIDYCYSVGNITFSGQGTTDTKYNYCSSWVPAALGVKATLNGGANAFTDMPGLNTQNAYTLTSSYPMLTIFENALPKHTWSGEAVTPTAMDEKGNVIISTPEELAYVIKNGGGANYVLANDIYLNDPDYVDWKTGTPEYGYQPKSWYTSSEVRAFTGSIDGQGHVVHGLYYTVENVSSSYGTASVALIPVVSNSAVVIENLGIDDSYIKYTNNAAGIIGNGSNTTVRTIKNCYVGENTTIIGEVAGGIFGGGDASLHIENCYSLATLGAATKNGGILGGTWRYTYSGVSTSQTVINCYATTKLYGNSGAFVEQNVQANVGTDCKGQGAIKNFNLGEPYCATKDSYPTLRIFAGLTNEKDWNGLGDKVFKGSGNEKDPYIVETANQLAYISYTGASGYYKMVKDIYINDVSVEGWNKNPALISWIYEEGRGNVAFYADGKRFKGTFDGNGYVIHGMWYPAEYHTQVAALFLSAQSATIKNLGLQDSFIYSGYTKQYAVENGYCAADKAASNANGISAAFVGWLQSSVNVIGCFSDSSVYLENYSDGNLCATGGIVGYTMNTSLTYIHTFKDCWSSARMKSSSSNKLNGILGSSWTSRYYAENNISIGHTPYMVGASVSSMADDSYKNNYTNFGVECNEYTLLTNDKIMGANALQNMPGLSDDVWYAVKDDETHPMHRIYGTSIGDVDENGIGKGTGDIIALRSDLIGAEDYKNTDFNRNGKTDICDLVEMNLNYRPTITFNANGGKFANGKTNISKEIAVGAELSVELPALSGYGCVGWSLEQGGEKIDSDVVTPEMDGAILYAVWEKVLVLDKTFANNMVLQRNKSVCVWGTGEGSGEITLGNQTKSVSSNGGTWEVYFEPMEASTTPVTFKTNFAGIVTEYENVLVGDVYIASGQSNMEFNLKSTEQTGTVEDNSLLRFAFRGNQGWKEFSSSVVENATAIGVLFAQELSYALDNNIPIGIISCSKGASRIDDWVHEDYCFCEEFDFDNTAHSDYEYYDMGHHDLYKDQIQPIEKFTTAGILWYQGESNRGAGEAYRYLEMFEIMVDCWRTRMDDPTLPFYTVQIMLYQGNGTGDRNGNPCDEFNIRIAQGEAARTMDGVTVCTFLSYEDTILPSGTLDIHPTDKLPIAKALANAALSTYYYPQGDYDKTPEYSGPLYDKVTVSGSAATITFTHVAEGLMLTKGTTINDVEVRKADGTWVKATATLSGNVVTVSAEGVTEITGVRMGYMNRPDINLYNTIGGVRGYCASPFVWTAN